MSLWSTVLHVATSHRAGAPQHPTSRTLLAGSPYISHHGARRGDRAARRPASVPGRGQTASMRSEVDGPMARQPWITERGWAVLEMAKRAALTERANQITPQHLVGACISTSPDLVRATL